MEYHTLYFMANNDINDFNDYENNFENNFENEYKSKTFNNYHIAKQLLKSMKDIFEDNLNIKENQDLKQWLNQSINDEYCNVKLIKLSKKNKIKCDYCLCHPRISNYAIKVYMYDELFESFNIGNDCAKKVDILLEIINIVKEYETVLSEINNIYNNSDINYDILWSIHDVFEQYINDYNIIINTIKKKYC